MSDLRSQLQSIYDEHDELTPKLVVQVARKKSHPLHPRVFDKPVKEAAEAYYLGRAHDLITSVSIVFKEADENGPAKKVRAFHAVYTDKGHVYEPIDKVKTDAFTRRIVLQSMEREWRQLYDRYEQFEEFLSLVSGDLAKRRAA